MAEIKNHEHMENIEQASDFKEIKPESAITVDEAKAVLRGMFKFGTSETASIEQKSAIKMDLTKGDPNLDLNGEQVEKQGLTEEEKALIKEETNWSDEIINCIKSMRQYEIYKNAGLKESEINGRKCLIKDIDLDYVDPKTGLTNRELMQKGRSPYDSKTGERIELHHMDQSFDSPLAELCADSEHGDGNHKDLHDYTIDSFRRDPHLKNQYNNIEKPNYWKARAME